MYYNNVSKCENDCISGDYKKSSAYLKWTKKCWQRSKYFEVSSWLNFLFLFKFLIFFFNLLFYRLKKPIEKPLVLILSWLLGKQKHIVKYVSIFFLFHVRWIEFNYDRQKRLILVIKNFVTSWCISGRKFSLCQVFYVQSVRNSLCQSFFVSLGQCHGKVILECKWLKDIKTCWCKAIKSELGSFVYI